MPKDASSEKTIFDQGWAACKADNLTSFSEEQKAQLSRLKNCQGYSLLQKAILDRDLAVIKTLIKCQIAVDALDSKGQSALHYAALQGLPDIIVLLLESISVDAKDTLGQTPLHSACCFGQTNSVKTLLANSANFFEKATIGLGTSQFILNPIQQSAIAGELECLNIMLEHANQQGQLEKCFQLSHPIGNLLHISAHFHRPEVLKLLLTSYSSTAKKYLETSNQEGYTPLMLAATLGDGESVTVLVSKGANLEQKNAQERTALHLAAGSGQKNSVEILCYYGADLNAFDAMGQRPYDLAQEADPAIAALTYNLMKQADAIKNMPPLFTFRPPQNLVFKGGGPKGLAYLGAVDALERKGGTQELQRIAGTSAGAINAALMAVGFSAAEMSHLLYNTDLASFLDNAFIEAGATVKDFLKHPIEKTLDAARNLSLSSVVQNVWWFAKKAYSIVSSAYGAIHDPTQALKDLASSIWHTTGLCQGQTFLEWMETQIALKTAIDNCTFGELRALVEKDQGFKHLYVYTMRLNPADVFCINSEDPKWDDVIISHAVRASMSIPGIFQPHHLHRKQKTGEKIEIVSYEEEQFVDGGILYNFPIDAFDKKKYQTSISLSASEAEYHMLNKRTLGFSLYPPEYFESKQAEKLSKGECTISELIQCVISIYYQAEELIQAQILYNNNRVIKINNQGVGMAEFGITPAQKENLIRSGRTATYQFYQEQEERSADTEGLFLVPRTVIENTGCIRLKRTHPDFIGRDEEIRALELYCLTIPSACWLWSDGLQAEQNIQDILESFHEKYGTKFDRTWAIDASSPEALHKGYVDLALDLHIDSPKRLKTNQLIKALQHAFNQQTNRSQYSLIFNKASKDFVLPFFKNVSVLITSLMQPHQLSSVATHRVKKDSQTSQVVEIIASKCVSDRKECATIALAGEAGVGKTELAVAFCNKFIHNFSLVYTIDCVSEISYQESYRELAQHLKVYIAPEDPIEVIRSRVHRTLEQKRFGMPWILIFDGANHLVDLPQRGEGCIIVTTRRKDAWASLASIIEVKTLRRETGRAIVQRIAGYPPSKSVDSLLERLNGLPLAINQAAHYLANNPSTDIKMYEQLLESNMMTLIHEAPADQRYASNLVAAWKVTAQIIKEHHPHAYRWLSVIAYLAPADIPDAWLIHWLHIDNLHLSKYRANHIKDTLSAYDIVRPHGENHSVHGLHQAIIREVLAGDSDGSITEACGLLVQDQHGYDRLEDLEWNQCSRKRQSLWAQHAYSLAQHAHQSNHLATAKLLNRLGNWKTYTGWYQEGQKCYEQAIAICKNNLQESSIELYDTYHNLAWNLEKQRKHTEANSAIIQALSLAESTAASDSKRVAESTHLSGWIQASQGNYSEAEASMLKAAQQRDSTTHPHVQALAKSDLGWVKEKQGQKDAALQLYKEAYNDLLDHPYGLSPLRNLARIELSNGKCKEAKTRYQEAIDRLKDHHQTDEHPDIAKVLIGLADAEQKLNRQSQALNNYEAALKINKKFLRLDHPVIHETLQKMLSLLIENGDSSRAAAVRKEMSTCNCSFDEGE